MIYGYARVSTDGQSVDAQVRPLTKAGCKKVFRDVHVSGAKTDGAQLRRVIEALEPGDVLMVTRLDRLARSTRDLLNTLAAVTAKKAGFKSLGDTWADTTTSHGRLMLTVLGGLAEFERDLIRARTGEGRSRAKAQGKAMGRPPLPSNTGTDQRGHQTPRARRDVAGIGQELRPQHRHHAPRHARRMTSSYVRYHTHPKASPRYTLKGHLSNVVPV
jgi:DNA invertase Pin-like site-specific DNA recombinase